MSTWLPGYSAAELDAAQEQFGLRFPPDLVQLLRERRPARGYDWRTDEIRIREVMAWPLDGLLFDVERNALWLDNWGDRPATEVARREAVTRMVEGAPRLIPLIGHRYLPAEPCEAGNPVFSIHQADIIHYGANLEHYFTNEFSGWSAADSSAYRHIRFWSDFCC